MLKRNKRFTGILLGTILASTLSTAVSSKVFAASDRLWGQDRYETSVAISTKGWTNSDYIVIASGEGYADALCAAPLAKKYNAPILLTESKKLNEKVKEEIKRLNPKQVFIIGKYASVSEAAEAELKTLVNDIKRLGGNDRYETSVVVAKELGQVDGVTITSGLGFADALSIAPIAAQKNMPILLTGKSELPEVVGNYIKDNNSTIKNTYVVGGTGVISDAVAEKSSPSFVRLSGSDRFETNLKVMDYFKNEIKFDNLYIVQADGPTGNEFADALSGSALAVKTSSPVVLTYKNISDNIQNFIKNNAKSTTNIVALGGTAAVSDTLVEKLKEVVANNASNTPQVPSTPSTGGTGGSGSSGGGSSTDKDAEANKKLKSIVDKLEDIEPTIKNEKEKEIVGKIITSINKTLADANYNFKNDASEVKALYNKLSEKDKDELAGIITSKISLGDLLELKIRFGL